MMQAMLRERFKLAVHSQTKDFAGFVLRVSPTGMKLKLSGTGKSQSPRSPGGESVPDEQPTMTSRQVSKDHCTVSVRGNHLFQR